MIQLVDYNPAGHRVSSRKVMVFLLWESPYMARSSVLLILLSEKEAYAYFFHSFLSLQDSELLRTKDKQSCE